MKPHMRRSWRPPVRFGDSGAAVRLLQMRLKELAIFRAAWTVNSARTQTAVSLFQKAHGWK